MDVMIVGNVEVDVSRAEVGEDKLEGENPRIEDCRDNVEILGENDVRLPLENAGFEVEAAKYY